MRLVAAAIVVGLLGSVALAADPGDLPSSTGARIDNSVDAGLGFAGSPSVESAEPTGDAASISQDIFSRRDDAYGAFQRGYYLTALELALPRAQRADPAAQTLIAEIYANGLGVAENVQRASNWYALAAKGGDRMAAFELGLLYLNGNGVPEDRHKASTLFEEAADKGYAPAQYNLALLHVQGVDASPDLGLAAALMKSAADSGLEEAQYDYGNMLIEGAGVAPNTAEGAREVELAASQGLVEAEVDYATMLYLGRGVQRDLRAAVGWYQQAANAGNAVGQNRIAKLLAVGEGIPQDLKQAAMWRALARRQGLDDAVLDKLLAGISPKDLADAEELARFWPSPPPTANQANPTPAPALTPLPSVMDAPASAAN